MHIYANNVQGILAWLMLNKIYVIWGHTDRKHFMSWWYINGCLYE